MTRWRMTEFECSWLQSHMTGLPQMGHDVVKYQFFFKDNLLNHAVVVKFNVTNIIKHYLEITNENNRHFTTSGWKHIKNAAHGSTPC